MATAVKNQIIARSNNPNVTYRLPKDEDVELTTGWVVVRASTDADANMAQAPSDSYKKIDPTGKQKQPSEAHGVSQSNEDGYSVSTNIQDVFNRPGELISLDFVALKTEKPKVVSQPGLVDNESAILTSNALRNLCTTITSSSADGNLTPFLLSALQLGVTYSTVRGAQYNDSSAVVLPLPGQQVLKYGDLRSCMYGVLEPRKYDNPMRQYLRHFSLTTCQAIQNGKIQPNEKVSMQHGALRKWVAYTFDFMRPGYGFMDANAAYAWQLAQKTAFDRKQKSNQQEVHNTAELGYKA